MDQDVRVGATVAGLGAVLALSLAAVSTHGEPYVLWADFFFGLLASGLFILGLQMMIQSRRD